ncbi:protease family m28 plasma glutamate carboxypeptidase-related [Holotrichia oblita]|uniref:Protease family m28 plasma glutamate carboxypeptidase-related n=1 Tax=Holotrichia oblita TaxID=644536 RepID=A0ACB9SST2_HOLOL|nr:protease family m28 plasma glutamate carboxypeptidase-related [Holotrichia oblita]
MINTNLVLLVGILFSISIPHTVSSDYNNEIIEQCNLPTELLDEIKSYGPKVSRIIQQATTGKFKGFVYDQLAAFVDTFGNRLTGTENLENAIDFMLKKLEKFGLNNVHGEEVTVPKWVRGNESAILLSPRMQKLAMLGLGDSIGTPPEGITAEAIVVDSFDELDKKASEVPGKIVVFNEDWVSYGETVKYRDYAAPRAAAYGAVATLVRSVTPFSLNTPHTGWQDYNDSITKIPTACITIEDAHMLRRMYDRGSKLIINVKMGAQHLPNSISRNTVAEIEGVKNPEKVVLVSGHLDSWDVGTGAMDDGAGAFISWGALAMLSALNFKPRRTIRSVLWTGEEVGLVGAFAYAARHKQENQNFNLLMESDEGTFNPLGIEFGGSDDAACIIQEIVNLLHPINATNLRRSQYVGSDIMVWANEGIPSASLLNENEKYFWYHHSDADTMDVEDSAILDKCLAVWTTVACHNKKEIIQHCNLSKHLIHEIKSYGHKVNQIIQQATTGKFKGFVHDELAAFVDKFGNRLAGTENLENAIDFMLDKLKKLGLDNVHGEEVTVPKWERGNESAVLLSPRVHKLAILGLGYSVGTPPEGITAETIVVDSFDELDKKASEIPGKIVVFNEKWTQYGETVKYRTNAAPRAAAYGAVAALIKSVTPFSLNSPHTGLQRYNDSITKIPVACITVEDAHMLRRIYDSGSKLIINIKMEAQHLPSSISRNTIAEIEGSKNPEKVVLISGHLDSWDVGVGAMDDGGGAFITWGALALLHALNLKPRRTIRSILWTAEEIGLLGAIAYAEKHKNESENLELLMESDEGTFNPLGIDFGGSDNAACIMKEILKLLHPINATTLKRSPAIGADTDMKVWDNEGIPRAVLLTENEKYFWYHHTDADTMDVQDPVNLDKCLAVWTTVAYVVADLSVDLSNK